MRGSIRCLACRRPNKDCTCRGETRRELRVYTGRDAVTGQPRQQSKTVRAGKRDADNELARFIADITDGAVDSTATLGAAMDYWVEHVAAKERGAGTLRNYRQITRVVHGAPLGSIPLNRLDTHHIQAFYDGLRAAGRKPNTIGRYHAAVRGALNLAVSRGWIKQNPSLATARPSIRNPELTIPSPAQVKALIAAAERMPAHEHCAGRAPCNQWCRGVPTPERATFLRVAAATWARRGEIVALRRNAILLGARPEVLIATSMSAHQGLKDTKTHGKRQISVDTATAAAIADHLERMDKRAADAGTAVAADGYVFSDAADCSVPWHVDTPTDFFALVLKHAGVAGVRLHDLRHFGATQALAAGVPITTVSYRLGHSKVTTTLNTYAHFLPATDHLASALMGDLLDGPAALPPGSGAEIEGAPGDDEDADDGDGGQSI